MTLVGKSIPRKEGRRKVTGQALYVDDLKFDGMLHGVTVRSSVPRGRIKSISYEGDIPWNEFTTFQHIGILSLEFHVDKLSRPLL